ncbi:ATP-binding protein [Candidatus Woesearchaeota archaeon]|nr:ATP-binding protein [Candidatus Woesearchaeota archaeon]
MTDWSIITKEPLSDILGQERAKQHLKSALLVDRHVIISGPPGIGKTTIAKNIARLLPTLDLNDCEYHCNPKTPACPTCISTKTKTKKVTGSERFIRIQGSPDLTVEDLLGDIDPIKALKSGPLSIEAFTPGKIFRANQGILFFDEVNRCPEKLQNSLLQVLEEGKATLGAYSIEIPANFIFIGTMNPDDSSTESLSEVFLDRFDIVEMTYPETLEIESRIVLNKGKRLEIGFPPGLLSWALGFVRDLRSSKDIEKKPSVRASLGIYERAQAHALLSGRKTVTHADIEAIIVSVIAHRITLKPSVRYTQSPEEFVQNEFQKFKHNHPVKDEQAGGSL